MSTKEVELTLKDDKQELQKQLGCMNGLFQIFDRRFLLGQRRHDQNQKRPSPGQSDNGEKELRNPSEQAKENGRKVVMKDNRVSVEIPRNSFSSTSSSTATSSLGCSTKVQTEFSSSCQSVVSEISSSPFIPKKQPEMFMPSPDIRDVVKDSMTREPRAVSIKKVAQEVQVGPAMKHIDSPRPITHQKPVQFGGNGRNDRNLVKVGEIQCGAEKIKEMSRFSCDGRESRYQLKSNVKIKELPRLSLDSRQGYNSSSANDPISYRRLSSSVVAKLMGLEALTTTTNDNQTLKAKSEEPVLNSRSSQVRKDTVSPQRGVKVGHVITRIPLETAPWKQEGGRGPQKSLFKSKEGPVKTEAVSRSIYGEIEKRLTEHEYKTAGKDLRALKQILEAMQKTKSRLESKELHFDDVSIDDKRSQKSNRTVSPIVNVISPRKVQHADATMRETKRTGRPRPTSIFPEHSRSVSPRMQRSKNNIHVSSSDSSRPKKQPNKQPILLGSTTRNRKSKPMDQLQDSTETRNSSQVSDTVSFKSENDSEVTSTEWAQEVISPFRSKENHKIYITERVTEERSTFDQAKHNMEQPSPVSVLDVFYTEDTPSPVKKKSCAFSDDEMLHYERAQDQTRINYLADQYSEFNNMKLKSVKNLVHQIELLNTNIDGVAISHTLISPYDSEIEDDRYIEDVLMASGCLKDLDQATTIVQLQPSLINPELFNVLEKTKGCTDYGYNKKNMRSKLRRKLVFDTLNDVLGQRLATVGPFGPHKGKILNGKKLMKEMCSEIKSLQNNSEVCIYDEDDEVINIINTDTNKRSQDWDECYNQVPGLVLDIERMIFRDLVNEVVNGHVN